MKLLTAFPHCVVTAGHALGPQSHKMCAALDLDLAVNAVEDEAAETEAGETEPQYGGYVPYQPPPSTDFATNGCAAPRSGCFFQKQF